jgi:acyl carrier protein
VAWDETGEDTAEESSFTRRQRGLKIGLADCFDAVESALKLQEPDVIVSTRDFSALLEERRLQKAIVSVEGPRVGRWERVHPEGGPVRPRLSTAYEEPRNQIEKLVVQFWKTALGFQTIGIHDNFFEFGGHSLLAIQLVKKINDTFSTQVALRDFFDAPTVAQLALLITRKPSAEGDAKFLEAVLNEIEGLSDKEVESALRGQA